MIFSTYSEERIIITFSGGDWGTYLGDIRLFVVLSNDFKMCWRHT